MSYNERGYGDDSYGRGSGRQEGYGGGRGEGGYGNERSAYGNEGGYGRKEEGGYGRQEEGEGYGDEGRHGRGGYDRPQDPSEYGGGGRGNDNYYTGGGGGMSGGQDYRTGGGGGGSGYGGSGRDEYVHPIHPLLSPFSPQLLTLMPPLSLLPHPLKPLTPSTSSDDDDYSGALHHAQEHGNSEDSSLFSSALGMLSGKKKHDYANEDMDEDSAVRAHQAMYNSGEDSGSQHSSQTMGAGAAMQALKLFTSSSSSSNTPQSTSGGSNSQNAFIGLAMGQAARLFDEQSAQGKVEPGADKQSVVNDAAKMALKMYLKSGSSQGGAGGGPGGLLGMASKFL
ncbi:MAG: hypothetical protein Q9207_005016 [Kuettlingeria erythrocarpa]